MSDSKRDSEKSASSKSSKKKEPAVVSIKSPGGKIKDKESGKADPSSRRRTTNDSNKKKEDAASTKKSSKSTKRKGKARETRTDNKKKETMKAKKKVQKGCIEKIAKYFGYHVGKVELVDPMALEAVDALDLKPWHLRRLRSQFDKIDIDGSGNIDYDEFFEAVGENRSPFTDKLFALIDLDGSGTIEFDEYVRVMATYCMFTKDEILRFCFECFDVDKSGTIDEKEFIELCKCINNAAPSFPTNFKKALEEFDVNEDGLIDYGEFVAIDHRYPLVLFPALRLQDTMQKNSLGESTWLQVIENYEESKRIEEYKATHGGRAPPDTFTTKILKCFCPFMYQEKVHIKVGKDMEDRHRKEAGV